MVGIHCEKGAGHFFILRYTGTSLDSAKNVLPRDNAKTKNFPQILEGPANLVQRL
jgi:hypothetical protein